MNPKILYRVAARGAGRGWVRAWPGGQGAPLALCCGERALVWALQLQACSTTELGDLATGVTALLSLLAACSLPAASLSLLKSRAAPSSLLPPSDSCCARASPTRTPQRTSPPGCLPGLNLQVDTLLESIPRMFAGTQVMETCAGAALRSAVEALKGGVGGKVRSGPGRCVGFWRGLGQGPNGQGQVAPEGNGSSPSTEPWERGERLVSTPSTPHTTTAIAHTPTRHRLQPLPSS